MALVQATSVSERSTRKNRDELRSRRPNPAPLDRRCLPCNDKFPMPRFPMPQGALIMLVLRVLRTESLHGYAIAQRIRQLSDSVLDAEEGSLYPTLQRMLMEGWVSAEWGISETKRRVRFYTLTEAGKQQLKRELAEYRHVTTAIQDILRTA